MQNMKGYCVHLPEVVAYESQTTGGLLWGEIWKHLFFEESVLEAFLDNNNNM